MWDGQATIGDFWAAYAGGTDQNSVHAHVAVQLAVAREGELGVELRGGSLRASHLLIGPLVEHRVEVGADVRFFYIEPRAPLGRALRGILGEAPALAWAHDAPWPALPAAEPARAVAALEEALGVERAAGLDPRLERALAVIEASDGRSRTVAEAAREVGLSASRLRSLAREALGAPLSRWMLWRKLERSLRAVAGGARLVDAAAEGAFSDQAHLARTMRRMFGVTPREASRVLR